VYEDCSFGPGDVDWDLGWISVERAISEYAAGDTIECKKYCHFGPSEAPGPLGFGLGNPDSFWYSRTQTYCISGVSIARRTPETPFRTDSNSE